MLGSSRCTKGSPFHTEGPTTKNARAWVVEVRAKEQKVTPVPMSGVNCDLWYSSYAIGFHSCFFFTTDLHTCTIVHVSIRSNLTDGEFPGFGLAPVPDVAVPEAEHWVRMKPKSHFIYRNMTYSIGYTIHEYYMSNYKFLNIAMVIAGEDRRETLSSSFGCY